MTEQEIDRAVDQLREELSSQISNILETKQNAEMDLLLTKISEQVQAELNRATEEHRRADAEEKLATSQAELVEEARKNRIASERRTQITAQVLERYAYLGRQLEFLIPMVTLLETSVREYFEEMADKLELLSEQITLLTGLEIADSKGDDRAKHKLLDEIAELPQKHKKQKLEEQYRKNIDQLEEQIALYGVLEVPLSLMNKLEAEKQRLRKLVGDEE